MQKGIVEIRATGARYYEYALGSARESRHWYVNAEPILGKHVVAHRLHILSEIIKLLITIVPVERSRSIKETVAEYNLIEDVEIDIPFAD